jgi:hypothetical protein
MLKQLRDGEQIQPPQPISGPKTSILGPFLCRKSLVCSELIEVKRLLPHCFVALATILASLLHAAESPVTIHIDRKNPGRPVPTDFSGLSFEASLLLPNENGVRYFRPDNSSLINLSHTLGIRSLRIGGNTSDRDAKQLPSEADLDSLFAFARAAGVKVIYCLRLRNGHPQADAATVKYIMSRYAPQMDCFSIGQEPSAYPVGTNDARPNSQRMGVANEKYQYPSYAADWKKFADVITATVPEVKLCGPGVHNNGTWAQKFMADFGKGNHVTLITEHLYPGGAGGKVPTAEIGCDRMLSDDFIRVYQKLHDSFATTAISNGLPYRLEEVNNFFNGGAKDVSDTFASALWGLDFMYWWAAHDAAGLNFHTGDRVAAGSTLQPSKYTAFFSTTNGYIVRPLGYGIKAFDLGSHGKLVPVKLSNAENLNLTAYAVLGDDKNLNLTIISKEHGPTGRAATVSIEQSGMGVVIGEFISLSVPNNDVSAESGETLGDGQIQSDGTWNGKWTPLRDVSKIKVPGASAVIVRLRTN